MDLTLKLGLLVFLLSFELMAKCHKFKYQDYALSTSSEYKIITSPVDENGMIKFDEYFQGQKTTKYHRAQDLISYQDAVSSNLTCVHHFQGTTLFLNLNGLKYRTCQMSSYFFLLGNFFPLLSEAQRDEDQEVIVSRAHVFNGIAKIEWKDRQTGTPRILSYQGRCQ